MSQLFAYPGTEIIPSTPCNRHQYTEICGENVQRFTTIWKLSESPIWQISYSSMGRCVALYNGIAQQSSCMHLTSQTVKQPQYSLLHSLLFARLQSKKVVSSTVRPLFVVYQFLIPRPHANSTVISRWQISFCC